MDAVITYVNGSDPLWQQDYSDAAGGKLLTKRYRDWGHLKYLLRGIQKHMPFIEKVHLVVSRESQIPEWINRDNVHVVLHSDIIPARFLPTFNSATIEMFLHEIPGLAEEFIYFNDDFLPMMDCTREDFIKDGKSNTGFVRHYFCANGYKHRVRNSDRQARLALGLKHGISYVRPQHTASIMLRSHNQKLFEFSKDKIYKVVSPLRTSASFNQYLFLDYLYFQGLTTGKRISNKHLTPAVHSARRMCRFILDPRTKLVCINDVQMSEQKFQHYKRLLTAALDSHFPEKSAFETD